MDDNVSLEIYIYTFIKKKTQTGHIRIINLFPSFDKIKKHEKKINRTSSDLMDKINQKLLLCNVCYIELFTRKIQMFTFE